MSRLHSLVKGKVFIVDIRENSQKHRKESRAERERSRLNTASRSGLAKAVFKGGEKSRGQTMVRMAGLYEETVTGGGKARRLGWRL